jgi:hypothetical protein
MTRTRSVTMIQNKSKNKMKISVSNSIKRPSKEVASR